MDILERGALADEELMSLVRQADAAAFEIIYDRHSGAAYSLAHRILGQQASAEDVLQEVFLTIWRAADRYDQAKGSCRGWILTITHHRSIDHLRKLTRHTDRWVNDDTAAERLPSREHGPETTAVKQETAAELIHALKNLPFEQRQVIELAYYGGYSHSEIADVLKIAPGTVKGRLRLGLEKLRGQVIYD